MRIICLVLALFGVSAFGAQGAPSGPKPYPDHLRWWGEARFGLFVHWGPVSLKGTEIGWSRAGARRGYGSAGTEVPAEVYDNLYREFNPSAFNAGEWASIADAAGMRYVVFTSRHHDGFSMFDTAASEHKITNPASPFRRDVVDELSKAFRERKLAFGLYYSQPDWRSPDAFTRERHGEYLAFLKQQITELCSNYGKLDVFWFDGLGKSARDYDGDELVRTIRRLQPGIVINDRTGLPEDHDTPEQRVGKYQDQRPWESCITICRQWSWKPGDEMKSLKECVHTLVLCAGGDGNLLLNVGPMPDGRIEPRQVDRLKEIGRWLRTNGESIYGTRGGPWKPTRAIASTRRGNTVFLHVLRWDGDSVSLPGIAAKVKEASLFNGQTAHILQTDQEIIVSVPEANRDPVDTVIRIELDESAMELPALAQPARIKADASNTYRKQVDDYGPEMAFDNDTATRWATDSGTKQAWITANFGKPVTIQRIRIDEALEERVQQFEFQYRADEGWKTVFSGRRIGHWFQKKLETPITGREFRLRILNATEGPTITDIEFIE